jgi:uncharacterized membrane protein YkvA (DUF1232 family)
MSILFSNRRAKEKLEGRYQSAEKIIGNKNKLERLLQRLEKKLRKVPRIGNKLAYIPIMISLVNSFAKKEYTDIPIGSLVSMVAALAYFVSPIDFFPDIIPLLGYIDDIGVIAFCWNLVESDIIEYDLWRKANGKIIDSEENLTK